MDDCSSSLAPADTTPPSAPAWMALPPLSDPGVLPGDFLFQVGTQKPRIQEKVS